MKFTKKAINTKEKYLILSESIVSISSEDIPFRTAIFKLSDDEIAQLIFSLFKEYNDYTFYYIETNETIISTFSASFHVDKLKLLKHIFEEHKLIDNLIFVDNNFSNHTFIGINTESVPFYIASTINNRLNLNTERIFKKKFICLNNVPKKHRSDLVEFMKEFRNQAYLSYKPLKSDMDSIKLDDINSYSNIGEWENKITNFHKNSFINIITETTTDNRIVFFTEKTDKAISAGQPFIILAGVDYLKRLKELGFKTFDKWWDESYDTEFDYEKRIEKIKILIKKLSLLSLDDCQKIYKEMLPLLIHNQKNSLRFKDKQFNNIKYELQ